MKKEIVYIVVELNNESKPKIINVFRTKKQAEQCAAEDKTKWRNVITKELI